MPGLKALRGADLCEVPGAVLVVRSGDGELVCKAGAVRDAARTAFLEVCRVEQRYPRRGVYSGKLSLKLGLRAGAIEHRAYAFVPNQRAQLAQRIVSAHDAK